MTTQPAQPQSITAPAVTGANKLAVTVQATDVTIAFGSTRQAFDSNGNHVGTAAEFHTAIALSPNTAKQLNMILSMTLSKYEREWGPIALDKNFIDKVAEMNAQPLITQEAAVKATAKRRAATGAKK